jgi:hypothetical protein
MEVIRRLEVGDAVVRKRHLKTRGTVLRIANERRDGVRMLWIKWDHPDTLPNPSLEREDILNRAAAP